MRADKCPRCGQPLLPGESFCRFCGSPAPDATSKPYRKNSPLLISILVVGALLLGVVLFLSLYRPGGKMTLGGTVPFGGGAVPPSGGEITITGSGTPLDGMTISVPEGAYDGDKLFTVELQDIKAHDFGELFNPITPLISIDNGGGFAGAPMALRIPIDISDGEFALAFLYDRNTEVLEALPLIGEDNGSITVQTCHFSDIVVSKVPIEKLVSADSGTLEDSAGTRQITTTSDASWSLKEDFILADSGFEPHVNDLQVVNNGSAICPWGHCAGQDIAAMIYYGHRGEAGWAQPLFDRYDNDGYGATPGFTLDDAHVQRLASVLQRQYGWLLNDSMMGIVTGATTFEYLGEDKTFYALVYAINMQHMPQYLSVRSTTDGGHALIAYKVTAGRVYVTDPNYPGKERWINYNGFDFETYYSGPNAESAAGDATAYDTVYFRAMNALVNKPAADALWQKLIAGGDPGEGWFPADFELTVCIGKDENGANMMVPLTDGMTLTTAQLASAGDAGAVGVDIVSPNDGNQYSAVFYEGISVLNHGNGQATGTVCTLPLQEGQHDIGVVFYRKFDMTIKGTTYKVRRFINFMRFRVTVTGASLTVEPEAMPSVSDTNSNTSLTGAWELVGEAYMLGTDGPVTPYDDYQHGSGVYYVFYDNGTMKESTGYTLSYTIEEGKGQFKYIVTLEFSNGDFVNYLLFGNDGRIYLPGISDETGSEFQVFEKTG